MKIDIQDVNDVALFLLRKLVTLLEVVIKPRDEFVYQKTTRVLNQLLYSLHENI